jgi:probable rRNA maturation factor
LVKNLQVSSQDISIDKKTVHELVLLLKNEFNLEISSLSISFISSNKLREVNEQFLNHNYDTDILTFNYSKKQKEIDGEILISFEEARYNSKKFNVNYGEELTRLVIHGVLHLLNFNDTDALSKKIMKKEENKLINKFNFALLAGK